MNKFKKIYILFFLIFFSKLTFGNEAEVTFLFSGEEKGQLEPCGCYEGQLGGIARRATLLSKLKNKENVLLPVSLGDLIKSSSRQEEIKIEILFSAMNKTGYVLHNLGEMDLLLDPQILGYLSQSYGVTLLSSNIEFNTPFPIVINKYVLKNFREKNSSFKIAFLGIVSQSLISPHIKSYINVYDPVETLRPLVKEIGSKAELTVLLSHASLDESIEIANELPGIDLIITGHGIDSPQEYVNDINNIPIISPGSGGKYVGIASYFFTNDSVEQKSVDVVPLSPQYKDSQEMVTLLEEYQQILKDEDLLGQIIQMPLPNGLSYVGSKMCALCHKKVYDHWVETGHGDAYTTLIETEHQYDPECIQCHTTGYGYQSGFLTVTEQKNLINVGCEGCHGAGSSHITNVNKAYGFTDEFQCERCHNSEHSPMFQFDEYWKKIKHPAEKPAGKASKQ